MISCCLGTILKTYKDRITYRGEQFFQYATLCSKFLLEANKMVSILCKKSQNLKARFFISKAKSAIHKAAVQPSTSSWNDLRDHSSHLPHSQVKKFSGIVPGKVMEWPETMRLVAL